MELATRKRNQPLGVYDTKLQIDLQMHQSKQIDKQLQ